MHPPVGLWGAAQASSVARRPRRRASGGRRGSSDPQHHHPASQGGENAVADPVCGMQVDRSSAAEHRQTEHDTYYFCSAPCAATFDGDPDRYTAPASGSTREEGEPR
ncbi:YHS domain-containing protein [Streptomyces sp. NPDC015127]|uniref:YHS domain-containing protein n=1 Tax=Streptomyces sp. NPDC015127 TaxID=3364939 RepID=UPI00370210DB